MDDLHLSKDELYEMPTLYNEIKNVESILYEYNYSYIIKVFNTENISDLFRLFARTMFWKDKNFNHLLNPKFCVFIDDIFKGFGMKRFNGKNIRDYMNNISIDNKIEILKKLSMTLKDIHNNGVIIGDLSYNNVLTDGNIISFCDVNSMGFSDRLKPLMLPFTLINNKNISENDKGTFLSDVFIINSMVFDSLMSKSIFPYFLDKNDYKNYIDSLNLPNEIFNIFYNIYDIFNDNPVYPHDYIDTLGSYIKTKQK